MQIGKLLSLSTSKMWLFSQCYCPLSRLDWLPEVTPPVSFAPKGFINVPQGRSVWFSKKLCKLLIILQMKTYITTLNGLYVICNALISHCDWPLNLLHNLVTKHKALFTLVWVCSTGLLIFFDGKLHFLQ